MDTWTFARIARYIIMLVFVLLFGAWLLLGMYSLYAQRATGKLLKNKNSTHHIDSTARHNIKDSFPVLSKQENEIPLSISGKDYIDERIQIKNFDIDFAGLIVGAVGVLLSVLLIFTFKDLEKLEKLKFEISELKVDVEKKASVLSHGIENAEKIRIQYTELINTDFITFEDLFSRFLTALYQKNIRDIRNNKSILSEKDYNEINLAIARAKINTNNEVFKNQGIDIFFALGTVEDLPFLREILLNTNESKEYKERILSVIEKISSRIINNII